jgi:hypothetical protein
MLVLGAVEVQDLRLGRICLSTVPDYSATSLHAFLAANLAPGATVRAGEWLGDCSALGINHDPNLTLWRPAITASTGYAGSSPSSKSGPWLSPMAYAASISSPISSREILGEIFATGSLNEVVRPRGAKKLNRRTWVACSEPSQIVQ